jgi:hypothetical protein
VDFLIRSGRLEKNHLSTLLRLTDWLALSLLTGSDGEERRGLRTVGAELDSGVTLL